MVPSFHLNTNKNESFLLISEVDSLKQVIFSEDGTFFIDPAGSRYEEKYISDQEKKTRNRRRAMVPSIYLNTAKNE